MKTHSKDINENTLQINKWKVHSTDINENILRDLKIQEGREEVTSTFTLSHHPQHVAVSVVLQTRSMI